MYVFAQIFKYFALLLKKRTSALPFWNRPWCYPIASYLSILITSHLLFACPFHFFHDTALIHVWYNVQGFPNKVKGWGKSHQCNGWEILLAIFCWVVGIWGGVNLTVSIFSKAKKTSCKCWTSINFTIKMTCVYKWLGTWS